MSHDLPFGADTLIIPFTFAGGRSAAPTTGMSRMRPRHTDRLAPPGDDAPAGSIAPIRAPRSRWDPPLSYARPRDDAALLVSSKDIEEEIERSLEELRRELPEPVPNVRPPIEPHSSRGVMPQIERIPARGGGPAPARGLPRSTVAPPLPGPAEGQEPATQQSRSALRRAMEDAGLLKPNDPRQSHHLVPRGGAMNCGRDPDRAQQRLQGWGIDLDSMLNGVPLSRQFHARIHTARYYAIVSEIALTSTSRDEMEHGLALLRSSLLKADQEFQQNGKVPNWITGDDE